MFGFVFWTAVAVLVDMARFAAAATDATPLESAASGATKRAGVESSSIEAFDPEAALGVPLSGCVTVTGLTKVFFGTVNSSRDPVEAFNDGVDATQLGLTVKNALGGDSPETTPAAAGPTFNVMADLLAVVGVDLVLAPGQITCLLGPNGSGKTTTVGLMTGSIPATGGKVSFFGKQLTKATVGAVRANLGVCPQHNVNFDGLTAREHLRIFARIRGLAEREGSSEEAVEQEISRRLEEVGLSNADCDRSVNAFSGGMRRMLSVAAALLGDNAVVLLDEPTSGCDPMTRRHLWDLVLEQRRLGRCVIFTTHELSEAEALADRIVVMKRGRLVASGGKLFLKKTFTDGYKLSARTPAEAAAAVEAALRRAAAEAEPDAASAGAVTVSVMPAGPSRDGGTTPGRSASPAAASTSANPVADASSGLLAHGTTRGASAGGSAAVPLSGSCSVHVTLPWAALAAVPALLEALEAAGCSDVHLVQETLESVFLAIANAPEEPLGGQSRKDVERMALLQRLTRQHGKAKAAEIMAKEVAEDDAASTAAHPRARAAGDAVAVAVHPAARPEALVSASAARASAGKADAAEGIVLPEHTAHISVVGQTRALVGRRFASLMSEPSAVFWVVVFPVAYLITAIVLISLYGRPSDTVGDSLALGPAVLDGQGVAWVPSPFVSTAAQNLLAEQFACTAAGLTGAGVGGANTLPLATAITNGSLTSLPLTAGCNGVATTVSSSGDSMLVGGRVLVTRFPSEAAMQAASLTTAKLYAQLSDVAPAHGASTPAGFVGSAQFAGGLVLSQAPLDLLLFGGALPQCRAGPSAASFFACNATAAPQSGAAVAYNSSLPASQAWLAAALSSASLRLALNDTTAGISVSVSPLPSTTSPLLIGFLAAMFIGVSVTNTVMSGAFEIALDRQLETRRKMQIMGLRRYFASIFAFDFAFAVTPLIIAVIVAAVLRVPVLGDARLPGFVVSCLLYLPAGAMFGYLISIAFVGDVEVGGAIIPLTMTFSGILPHLIAQSIEFGSGATAFADGKALRDALSFIPTFNFYNVLQRLALLDISDPAATADGHTLAQVFGYEQGAGYNLMWMGIIIVVEVLLLHLSENWEQVRHWLRPRQSRRPPTASGSDGAGGAAIPGTGVELATVGKPGSARAAAPTPADVRAAERDRAARMSRERGTVAAVSLTHDVVVSSAHAKANGSRDAGSTKRILEDWSLGIAKGEVVALLGPAGAGKTSAMRVLVGDAQASNYGTGADGLSGQVFMDGRARELSPGFVGYCPQVDALWPDMTVNMHLNVFAAIRGVPVSERESLFATLCDALDLTRHRTKTISQLSGGNKRKVGLATAVLGLPGTVICDEPSTGVDPAARRAIWAVIGAARAGAAQLVSTHSMDEASRLGDRVAIMAGGRLLAIGSPAELQEQHGGGLLVDIETDGGISSGRIETLLVSGIPARGGAAATGPLLPGAVVRDRFGAVLKLIVPWTAMGASTTRAGSSRALQLAAVFRAVSELAAADSGLKFFSVTEPTLDQVFISVVGQSLAMAE